MAATVEVVAILSFFISICANIVAGDDQCSYSSCRKEEAAVQFPFTLEGHQDTTCGYPGFNLSCDQSNRTVLDLGTSGKFLVRLINYTTQEVEIYDQDNCLPKRLINFDLTGTPFEAYYHQNIIFYNCSSNLSSGLLEPISCLSTPNYTVYVAAAAASGPRASYQFGLCDILASAMVPVTEVYSQVGYVSDLNADLHLLWDTPSCGECVVRGGTCSFKNRTKNGVGCFNLPGQVGLSKGAKYVLVFGIGGPGFFFLIFMACYVSGRVMYPNDSNNSELASQPPVFIVGLDEAVIQSYPKIVLGESRRLANPEDNICSICLSEYRAKDTLKTIPDCKHCFHAACIDQWLRRNVTCPICRNFPEQVPTPPPV